MGAVDNHLEETDPSWVKIKQNALEWTNRKVVTDLGPTSDTTQFFDNDDNRLKLFMAPGETRGAEVQVPQLPLILIEIELKTTRTDTTPWELYQILIDFEVGKDNLVKEYLLLVKNWTKLRINQEGGS